MNKYVPRYVRQNSDMEYGSVVTHENYNEKLNLLISQGDYNTDILDELLNEESTELRFPFLSKIIENMSNELNEAISAVDTKADNLKNVTDSHSSAISNNAKAINEIITGTTKVPKAVAADKIFGIDSAGNHKYYGTNYNGVIGFHPVPDSIYCEDIQSDVPEINDIVFVPRANSVTEDMMVQAVKDKLNRQSITDYPDLNNKPTINNVELTGDLTLQDLGIQPAGNYLTEIPSEYVTTTDLNEYLTSEDAAITYATITALNSVSNTVSGLSSTVGTLPRIFINTVPSGTTPHNGDMLVML